MLLKHLGSITCSNPYSFIPTSLNPSLFLSNHRISPSPPPSPLSQWQTSCGVGALLPVDLDWDAVVHQRAPHNRTGVVQMCEYADVAADAGPLIELTQFKM